MLTDEERIERMARELFYAYREVAAEYNTLDRAFPSNYYDLGKTLSKRFIKIAQHCVMAGVAPLDYMRAIFDYIRRTTSYVIPKDITILLDMQGNAVLAQYFSAAASMPEISSSWEMMEALLRRLLHTNRGSTVKDILMDPMKAFTAWFRICRSETIDEELFDKYKELACEELLVNKALHAYLLNKRPQHMQRLEELINLS